MSEKHLFAIFYQQLSQLIESRNIESTIALSDKDIVHRMQTVLRLKPQDECILFDRHHNIQITIKSLDKKSILCVRKKKEKNKILEPKY
jgi:16S rRNA U1498 N3-methylase RsmE